MIKRLRPKYSDEELKEIYAVPHQHDTWEDHRVRVETTINLAKEILGDGTGLSAADLSCGDATIIRAFLFRHIYLGDFAPGYDLCGPIEQTILRIQPVDVFFCCETLEHVDDPLGVLRSINSKANTLVLSTPIGETDPSNNPEHYWGWDKQGISELLSSSNWAPVLYRETPLKTGWYQFQIWVCRKDIRDAESGENF